MLEKIKTIGIVGAGQMGSGIAQVAAQAGYKVYLSDQTLHRAQTAKSNILALLKKQVEKGKITEAEKNQVEQKITPVEGLGELAASDFVIEAVAETPTLKFNLFKQLDEKINPRAILATNTSSISITAIAAQTQRPDRVIGMHFMNPVPLMKLVEGIRAIQTSDETAKTTKELAITLGKTYVDVKDIPGFVVNRILMPMINEAIQTLYEGIATAEDIDSAMKLGTNQPMGPLALADFIGLDTCLAIMQVLHEGLGDSKYRPSPLLKKYVSAGWLGKKVKRGFYFYE